MSPIICIVECKLLAMFVCVDSNCHFSLLKLAFESGSVCPRKKSLLKLVLPKLPQKGGLFVWKRELSVAFFLMIYKGAFVNSARILPQRCLSM